MFRAVAARLNYLSQRSAHIMFTTMKLCSKMSRPDAQDLKNMKRELADSSLENHELDVSLSGTLIQVPCTPLLTRIRQETDNQGNRSVEA